MHIDILLITYNRPQLLALTLNSLAKQTYRDFTVHLFDNGSQPAVDPSAIPVGLDVRLTRLTENTNQVDIGNQALQEMNAPIFVSLADDDVWTSHTLEIVAILFEQNAHMESLSAGFTHFDHAINQPCVDDGYLKQFTGELQQFDAREVGLGNCASWGIGPQQRYPLPRMAHSSMAFFKRSLLDRTIARQGALFIKPFGDVGYVGCCFNTKYVYYLDLPLGVIGRGAVRETDSAKADGRQKLRCNVPLLEHSPLRACSFFNMGADNHLKVLHRNGICDHWDCLLNLDFYVSHIDQVTADSVVTDETMRDLQEVIPHTIETAMRGLNRPDIDEATARKGYTDGLMNYIQECFMVHAAAREKEALLAGVGKILGQNRLKQFAHVLDYAAWQEEAITLPLLGIANSRVNPQNQEAAG